MSAQDGEVLTGKLPLQQNLSHELKSDYVPTRRTNGTSDKGFTLN
jgi:hypothetical protein